MAYVYSTNKRLSRLLPQKNIFHYFGKAHLPRENCFIHHDPNGALMAKASSILFTRRTKNIMKAIGPKAINMAKALNIGQMASNFAKLIILKAYAMVKVFCIRSVTT